jgi:hypothetical protein
MAITSRDRAAGAVMRPRYACDAPLSYHGSVLSLCFTPIKEVDRCLYS